MIRYSVLGSGSSGNSYLFSSTRSAVMVDAGFSLRELRRRTEDAGMDFSAVEGLCLTHMHPDHCRGAGVFARKTGIPVHVNAPLIEEQAPEFLALGIPAQSAMGFRTGAPFMVGDFLITAFATSHDSPNSVGFSLQTEGRCFTVLTDTGVVDESMHPYIGSSDVLFLEANYDHMMLESGPYPVMLKRRIAGDRGHLSNTDAIAVLNHCQPANARHVYFCHLSKTNNRPDVLASECSEHLDWSGESTICEHGVTYCGSIDPGGAIP